MKKTLILLRHGKAMPQGAGEDYERVLADRGIADAEHTGAFLASQGIAPDKILCSTAERTRQTVGLLQRGYGKPLSVEYSDALYLATDAQLSQIISAQPDHVQSLLVIAHNPGLHELALKLSKEGDEKCLRHLAMKFPTCALAQIALGSWSDKHGRLQSFITPKTLY